MFRMAPPLPASIIRRPNALVQWKVPLRTMSTTALNPFDERSSAAARKFPAALFTSPSTCPMRPATSWTAAKSRTSQAWALALPPARSICATTSSSFSLRRPSTTERAPSSAKRLAISAPRPVPPPVITKVLSFNSPAWNMRAQCRPQGNRSSERCSRAPSGERSAHDRRLAPCRGGGFARAAGGVGGGRSAPLPGRSLARSGAGSSRFRRYGPGSSDALRDRGGGDRSRSCSPVHGRLRRRQRDRGQLLLARRPIPGSRRRSRLSGLGIEGGAERPGPARAHHRRHAQAQHRGRRARGRDRREGPDLALWWQADIGEMASTTCYAPGPPEWLPRRPAEAFKDWVWTPSRPDAIARLLPQPRAAGAQPVLDLGPEFPHAVGRGKLDDRLYQAIRNTPAGTTVALRAARAAVASLKLGESGTADLLTVALASVDTVGHQYGTLSRERVDAVLRTHDELSAFLDELRKRLGARLSIVLTSDHGLTPTQAEEQRLRVQGGTITTDELIPRVNRALDEALGARQDGWVAGIEGNWLALRAPFPARAIDVAVEVLRREPGLFRVVPAAEVDKAEPFIRHSWFPGRSGHILLVVRPLWTLKPRDLVATHGSIWNDDTLVPLMVEAAEFRLRRDPQFRATQVAPTIAALLETAPPSAALDSAAIEHR